MKRLQQLKLSDGTVIDIEVEAPSGATPVSVGNKVKGTVKTLRETLETIPALVADFREGVVQHVPDASTVNVELGFTLKGGTHLVLASTAAEAHFKVGISWNLPK